MNNNYKKLFLLHLDVVNNNNNMMNSMKMMITLDKKKLNKEVEKVLIKQSINKMVMMIKLKNCKELLTNFNTKSMI